MKTVELLLSKTTINDLPVIVPATDDDRYILWSIADGELLKASTDDTRALWRHRKFFALLKKVLEHMPEHLAEKYPTTDKLLIQLKLMMGHFDVHTTIDGRDVWVATNSISFKSMGEKKFKEFVSECRDVILKHFLPDISDVEFDRNFMTLMFD